MNLIEGPAEECDYKELGLQSALLFWLCRFLLCSGDHHFCIDAFNCSRRMAFTCSKLTIEALEEGLKYVQI